MIKSPLRYPGGKSKAINQIVEYIPESFAEFREPFIGGGSVFIYLKQKFPHLKFWINDLNQELFLFWKIAQSDISQLVKEVRQIKDKYTDGKLLFTELTSVDVNTLSDLERAVRFFVLNRITFSGAVDVGGYSQQSFELRFTDSSIDRLRNLSVHLSSVHITCGDYENLLFQDGENVFIFLDPPYLSTTKSKLYGFKGNLHTNFDHERFAENMRKCKHKWLITYDNCPEIRNLFSFANLNTIEWNLQYGMNNYKQAKASLGHELIIRNY